MEKLYELMDRDVLLQFSEPSSGRLGFAEPQEFPDCSAKTTAMNRLLLLQTAAPVDYDGQRCGCDAGGPTKRFPSAVTSSAKSGNHNRTRRD